MPSAHLFHAFDNPANRTLGIGRVRNVLPRQQAAVQIYDSNNGNPSNLGMKTDYTNFAARLGASYRVIDQTVVRAGYDVSYVPFVDNGYA